MEYLDWLLNAKESYKFKTVQDFEPDGDPSIYLVHLGAPGPSIEDEIDADVPATCFCNLDEQGNNITLYSRLQDMGWEIGYHARVESTPRLFKGEIAYLRQFFDIHSYWCQRSFGVDMENAFFKMTPYIEDIINPSETNTQVLIVGNV